MPIRRYLAMTASEMSSAPQICEETAWMACHFSPYGTGLSNLPRTLPPGSLLILNDRTPIHFHDPALVASQLQRTMESFRCSGLLLDFQRSDSSQTADLVGYLEELLPGPVAVSDIYAAQTRGPVFTPPCLPFRPLNRHLAPWQGRDIWLDLSPSPAELSFTPEGRRCHSLPFPPETASHSHHGLACHYSTRVTPEGITFTLHRTREDLEALLTQAAPLGVTTAVALYQEWKNL